MKNIVLTGMMGSGKTTCGKLLAARLGLAFVDMDDWIVARAGRSIAAIFADEGEAYFRDLESEAARQLAARPGLVIATGGGVVIRPENMRALRKTGTVFFLNRSADEIFDRVNLDDRPLAQDGKAAFLRTFAQRETAYRTSADYIITNFSAPEATADEICRTLAASERRTT